MDTKTIDDAIAQLRKQKAHLEEVIDTLEMLGSGKRRRGRPPKFLSQALRAAEGARVNEAGAKKAQKAKKTTKRKESK
jgi:hypothetical protein